jgi:hypothetical protein
MDSTAAQISQLLDDDGQRWTDASGRHLDVIAETMGGKRTYRDGPGTDIYRWNFPDGSAICVAGDAWDFPLSTDSRCYCWDGGNRHLDGCPAGGAQ